MTPPFITKMLRTRPNVIAAVVVVVQAVYGLARSSDEAVMSAGMKALHNVLLRAQHLEGVGHNFSGTVRAPGVHPTETGHILRTRHQTSLDTLIFRLLSTRFTVRATSSTNTLFDRVS